MLLSTCSTARSVLARSAAQQPTPPPPPRRQRKQQRTDDSSSSPPAPAPAPAPAPPPSPPPTTATTTTIPPTRRRRSARVTASAPPPHLPRVLIIHTGGTLGMDVEQAYEPPPAAAAPPTIRRGAAASSYRSALRPGSMLSGLLAAVPELGALCLPTLRVAFNSDSSAIGPAEWAALARLLDQSRDDYDGFLVIHGTDTMAYTASAVSLMLAGFAKPVVLTGSQLPLAAPRSDARQNLIDAVSCIAAGCAGGGRAGGDGDGSDGDGAQQQRGGRGGPPPPLLQEVAVCFGGKLLRGNRCTKAHTHHYGAFESPSYPPLAVLGVDVEWNRGALLQGSGAGESQDAYAPRFELEPRVLRVPVVPGLDPRLGYGSGGEVAARGVRGVVLEAFGVGNIPDRQEQGWRAFLEELSAAGVLICLASQCRTGPLRPESYAAGVAALALDRIGLGPHTAECAVAKTMLCCAYPGELALGAPLAGEV